MERGANGDSPDAGALARTRQLSEAVIESLEEGVVVIDRDRTVVTANHHAEELLGITPGTVFEDGDSAVEAYLEDGTRLDSQNSVALRVLQEGTEIRDVRLRLVAPGGTERWVSANYLPLTADGDGDPQGVVWAVTDITESRRVADELEETERRFRDIAENVRAVFWIRNVRTGDVLYVSPAYEEIWGRPAERLYADSGAWLDAIHPDDRERVKTAALESEVAEDYECQYRIIRPDGTLRWIHDRAFTLRGSIERGEVVTGMAEDLTSHHTTEQALAEARERARAAFINAPIGSAVFSLDGEGANAMLEVNPALCAMLGYPEEELLKKRPTELIHPDDVEEPAEWKPLLAGEAESCSVERRLIRADGRTIWGRVQLSAIRDPDAHPVYGVAQVEDISSIRRGEAQQHAVARLGQEALEAVPLERLFERAAHEVNETLGTKVASVLEHDPERHVLVAQYAVGVPDEAKEPPDPKEITDPGYLAVALDERRPVVVENWARETEQEHSQFTRLFEEGASLAVPIQAPGGIWGVLSVYSPEPRRFAGDEVNFAQAVANVLGAAIQRWRAEEDTRHQALHDPLTELPNRTLFMDRLAHALERARRGGRKAAVLFMDLDHFKVINDSLGHEAGDLLLRAFAPRLEETLRPSDTVARFGGDEFVVLCEDLQSEEDAVHLAERILASLSKPFQISSHELFTTATIGVALARPGADPEGLIRDADAAMYRAKARGRARYELFDQAMRERVSERLRTENALRRTLADGGLSIHFQPIVALDDHSIVGAEALLRWCDGDRGWVPPAKFIPIAEESGLIVPIGEWVLEDAARVALNWPLPDSGAPPQLAVNLSARQVAHPEFPDRLAGVLERTGLPSERLSLEITESVLLEEAEAPMDAVRELKRLGVRLVLDDFGTGYSSLSYLDRLPIDLLKLDRSFIAPLRDDGPATAAIVSGVVMMAEALGMTVLAEGVEEQGQVEKLRALGCDFAQGFMFARPMPAEELAKLLRGALSQPHVG